MSEESPYCPKCGHDLPDGMALCHGCREELFRDRFGVRKMQKQVEAEFNKSRQSFCAEVRDGLARKGDTRSVDDVWYGRNMRGGRLH